MKYIFSTLIIASTIFLSACASTTPLEVSQGSITTHELLAEHSGFSDSYQRYQPDQTQLSILQAIDTPLTIISLFGTWCHDSEREVPRLIKLLQQANNPKITLALISVNHQKQADEKYRLKYTPTFVVFDQAGIEIGRIVERPTDTLAADIMSFIEK